MVSGQAAPTSTSGHRGNMNSPPANHISKGNRTMQQLGGEVEYELWEPQTVIVVIIFGLVCFLHLTAFLYTVCLHRYVSATPQTLGHPIPYLRKGGGAHKYLQCLMDSYQTPPRGKSMITLDM